MGMHDIPDYWSGVLSTTRCCSGLSLSLMRIICIPPELAFGDDTSQVLRHEYKAFHLGMALQILGGDGKFW
ncbi:hypothetical protein Pyn_24842 [Prunus yedoensis var. nudiflora]|uniref:Uncharacterized protein n=1 Tax=Prunus yedoensis var. nudiflora TaxID=2094558 RepID=A0A314ZQG0_PRUYE|nr:hypothetical protein Pyn_24842 [Prunus yedoensis var. nudiflora]